MGNFTHILSRVRDILWKITSFCNFCINIYPTVHSKFRIPLHMALLIQGVPAYRKPMLWPITTQPWITGCCTFRNIILRSCWICVWNDFVISWIFCCFRLHPKYGQFPRFCCENFLYQYTNQKNKSRGHKGSQ